MAKNMQPIVKRCRQFDISPSVMGYTGKWKSRSIRNPKGQVRKKQSEYAIQLNEKQKVKFVYGVLEKQFHTYYEKAVKSKGITGEVLLSTLERRLDNVVYRLGFAMTRREARQAVNHGHFTVNGKRVNIPSYLVNEGDVIEVCHKSQSSIQFKRLIGDEAPIFSIPEWLSREGDEFKGVVTRLPERSDIDFPIEEHLIVELYSR